MTTWGLNSFWIVSSMVLTEDRKQMLFFIPQKELPKFVAVEKGVLGNFDDMVYYYRRLHLPVNAPAKNMFSRDVKRLSFRCQTLKFPRPNVKCYFSTLLKGKMFQINKKGKNYQKGVPLSTICGIK